MLLSAFSYFAANAQTHSITGHVVDGGSNEPLPGVSVVVAGTKQGAGTDENGRF
ncbi:carboxypeptidase-like regulatory domain-containing protein, partial [Chitinophaga sp.]|uniref:carboxypeptidase-like regulatory domain-containing protein n=1 Tax=Chitinophaga sp. TaxID=1869181 RepID=UPI0039C8658D